ncbi:acyl carrier protein [Amycolatopsis sp. PS_44_ISF1]|uniref:acyl carrier protein n=1 Tax=Amycolatopsis sp. PS_44_ISF1 TaxID=2974917 RepID=UPI0028E08AF7|nr:acyl carrier protein [Amycolatopsis sp. PS_44_ISF1]MDT8913702.1 acyl carrier protein [Amycolatopsis sp. PS_44_ISF1]
MPDTFARVTDILTRHAGLAADAITPEATLQEAGVDSMAIAVLAMVLEEEHHLTIAETDLSGVSTIADLVAVIDRRLAATP